MKRVFAILLAACLLIGTAWADDAWYCRTCGTEVASPFCPTCGGTNETTGLRDGEWVCVCGRVNKSKFCGKCGTSREEAATAQTPKDVPEYGMDLQAMRDAQAGNIVTCGRYPQTAEGTDMTPIE